MCVVLLFSCPLCDTCDIIMCVVLLFSCPLCDTCHIIMCVVLLFSCPLCDTCHIIQGLRLLRRAMPSFFICGGIAFVSFASPFRVSVLLNECCL